jgi:hypothetical protein
MGHYTIGSSGLVDRTGNTRADIEVDDTWRCVCPKYHGPRYVAPTVAVRWHVASYVCMPKLYKQQVALAVLLLGWMQPSAHGNLVEWE